MELIKGESVMMDYSSLDFVIATAKELNIPISQLMLESRAQELGCSVDEAYDMMSVKLQLMEETIHERTQMPFISSGGLSGGDAYRLNNAFKKGITIGDRMLNKMLIKALACTEGNRCIDEFAIDPTTHICGVVPAVLLTIMEEHEIPRDKIVMELFTAVGIGMVIANRTNLSGTQAGCQAEYGGASTMAAGAAVEALGGTPDMVGHACSIALKNVLGLSYDSVTDFEDAPCIKHCALGVANALTAINLSLAGIESNTSVDEVIDTMKKIGDFMNPILGELAKVGFFDMSSAIKFN